MTNRVLTCLVAIGIICSTVAGWSNEFSSPHSAKIDPYIALMLEQPETSALIYRQTTGRFSIFSARQFNLLIKTDLDAVALSKLGISVQSQFGDIVTALVPLERIETLASHPQIHYLQAPRVVKLHNDVSMPEIGIPEVRNKHAVTGKGVIIGIIDTGIDWRHHDFHKPDGSTRIIAILDFSDPGDVNGDGRLDGPFKWGTTLHTETQINNALNGVGQINHKDLVGHGTHVAGTAAGNGRAFGNRIPAGTYVGVAPEADLVIVKATREPGGFNFDTADYLNGISFIDSVARALNRPYVINLSFGGSQGPHDGKDLSEQAIDNLLTTANGRCKAVVVSAGNEADQNIHASGTFGAGVTEIETKFMVPTYTAQSGNINDYIVFEGWYKAIYNYSVKIITPGGTMHGPISSGREGAFQTEEGTIYISNAKSGPSSLNGDKQILIQIYDFDANKPPKSGEWKITVMGSAGRFDLWLAGASMEDAKLTSNIDPTMILGTPGTAFHAITVGSYITKRSWIDLDGNSVGFPSLVLGQASSFSSPGPTRDGRTKPEICAPGEMIAASYSTDASPSSEFSIFKTGNSSLPNGYICQDGKHAVSKGTSFAAPHVSGLVALMLQKNPQLSPEQVRQAILASPRTDFNTMTVPNNKWGYGKIDARSSFQFITGQLAEKQFTVSIFQNPALTQYIDFYLISKYDLVANPSATIQVGSAPISTINMTAIAPRTFKGEHQFATSGTATLKITATVAGQSSTTLTEYFGVKLLRAGMLGSFHFDQASLSVAQNSLTRDGYFTIVPLNDLAADNEMNAIGPAYRFGPSDYSFAEPATISLQYEDLAVGGWDESRLSIYQLKDNAWHRLNCTVNPNHNIVSAKVNRLGVFRLFYDPEMSPNPTVPEKFELYQNYPNPFNNRTTISYLLPENLHVRLKIFNLHGELVTLLFDGLQQAGYHEQIWDGTNLHGQPVASGLYIYAIEAGKYSDHRKMVLLK